MIRDDIRTHTIPLCVAVMAGAILLASTAMALEDYSGGLLDLEAIKAAGAEVTLERYPNAHDLLVDDHILVQYETDGRSVMWDDTVVKVLTEKGKEEGKALSFYFTLPYSEAFVALLQVIKPDGTVVDVDVKGQSRVMVDRSQMSANIYNPNSKILQVGVPDLEVNDMVRFVACRKTVKPSWTGSR